MHLEQQIADFLAGETFAVVGASTDRRKYGNKVLRCYQQHSLNVVPVNPRATTVEGLKAVSSLKNMPIPPHAVSIITQPDVTEQVVKEVLELGIPHVWMQPGAESEAAVSACRKAGISVIHGGPCLLVVLGYRESDR